MTTFVEGATVTVTWQDNSTNETNFRVERKAIPNPPPGTPVTLASCLATPESNFAEIAVTAMNVTQFVDHNAVVGASYCYRVFSSNASGKSVSSNVAGITVPLPVAPVPAAPGGVVVTSP